MMMRRFSRETGALALSAAVLWVGCGGESRVNEAGAGKGGTGGSGGVTGGTGGTGGATGGSGGSTGGKGGGAGNGPAGRGGTNGDAGAPEDPDVPRKDGVPIGDCVEPEEAMCAEMPEQNAPCSLPNGTVCRGPIEVSGQRSYQWVSVCINGTWGASSDTCGQECALGADNQFFIEAADCAERTAVECESDGVYAWPPNAWRRAEAELTEMLTACNAPAVDISLELAFENGCPVQVASTVALTDAVVNCLARELGKVRWECAEKLPCTTYSRYLLD